MISFEDPLRPPNIYGGVRSDDSSDRPENGFDGNVVKPDQEETGSEKGWKIVDGNKSSSNDLTSEDQG